ncbi:histidine kinase [Acidothermaceae bacterium B102]|nr:histidine kinase [Acidothermaceae bacterium B102]
MSLALPRRVVRPEPGPNGVVGTTRRGWRESVVPGDVLLTLLALAVSSLPLIHDEVAPGGRWALTLGLVLPLLVRRTAPVLALSVIGAVSLIQLVADVRSPGELALLIALFTVADRRPRRQALIAAAAVEVLAAVAALTLEAGQDGSWLSLLFISGLVAAAYFAGNSLQTRRAYLAAAVDRAERLERERDQLQQLAVTDERNRIARELHDIIAHSLSVMITLADAARTDDRSVSTAADQAMAQVSATGREAMAEMRRLLGVLRDGEAAIPLTPQPTLGQLEELLEQSRAAGLPARLTMVGRPVPVAGPLQATVYRIVQEALTNALKHAQQPTRVTVALTWKPQRLEIDVSDDGAAVPDVEPGPGSHGIVGMRERVGLFDGQMTSGPGRSGGWTVAVALPVPADVA